MKKPPFQTNFSNMSANQKLPALFPHLIALAIFLVLCVAFFYPQLQGKVIQQSDIIGYRGASEEVRNFRETTGEVSLWTNSMFGGMPTYQISAPQKFNIVGKIASLSKLFFKTPIGTFLSAMIGFYILMLLLGTSHWLAIIGAIAFGFTTNNFILYEAGHVTKLQAISFFPLMTAGLLLVFRNKLWLGGLVFALGLALDINANHVQMTYLLMICFGLLVLFKLVQAIREQKLPDWGKAVGILAIGAILAAATSTSRLWTTYEYSKDTMRGEPILKSDGSTPKSSSETKGLEWGYAMQWSNGGLDLFASLIPGVVGGGSQEPLSLESATAKDLRKKGARLPDNFKAALYWGALPFTSGPAYYGAIICFLFLLGMVLLKGQLKWWMLASVGLLTLLSMGKNFELLNRLFFDYFPLYNKFRTPNSILSVVSFLVPLFGIYTLSEVVQRKYSKEEVMKALKVSGGILGGVCLFFALAGPSFFSFSSPGDGRMEEAGYCMDCLRSDRQSLMRMDALRSFALIAIVAGLLWAWLQTKIKGTYLLLGIGLLTLLDLWSVGRRYLDTGDFVNKSRFENNFKPRPVDEQILQDPDPHYRVFDLSIPPFESANSSYFHKTIGGYHPAKLQRYQDLIDRHISKNSQQVLNMLNTRYIISQEQQAQRNPNALGNAWFVGGIRSVPDANAEIDALSNFDPSQEAVIHQEFTNYVSGLSPQPNGSISLTEYKPNYLKYNSNSTSEQLAVFSEIWYGPDKGWQAYIDGNAVEHIRANYALRALRIPAGQHTIEFKFYPKAYYAGATISLIASLLLLLGFVAFFYLKGNELNWQTAPASIDPPVQPKAKLAPTGSKSKRKVKPKPKRKKK